MDSPGNSQLFCRVDQLQKNESAYQEIIEPILASNTWPSIELEALIEILRFLCLSSLGKKEINRLVSQELDEIWHVLILDESLYRRVCLSLPGKVFIDHVPFLGSVIPSEEGMQKAINSLITYVHHFGPFTEESLVYWPAVSDLASSFNLSLAEFNNRLMQMAEAK